MSGRRSPEFEVGEQRDIYEYVEGHGPSRPVEVAEALDMEPEQFNHELAVLKRDGYLEEREGTLRVTLQAGAEEEYVADGVEYVIRPARQEDLGGIVGSIREIAEERTYLVAESVAEQIDFEGVLNRNNDVRTRLFFVATIDGEVVGWAHVESPELEKLRHTAELTIGVLKEYRGHGIGSHLLHRGLEWAASNGYLKVYNSIPATNREAAEFLESHGWTTEAIRRDHYRVDDEFVDELMMARDLDS